MKKALAIDIGGTKIYNAIVDETGHIVSEVVKQPTPKTLDEIIKYLSVSKALPEPIISSHQPVLPVSLCL